ncbi:hypothetical protein BOW39_03260 [Solemya velum gill symbiont]|nr:hypothetical protein BOW39_03260 [Solemya velum gill symbiont]OOZ56894.1 hypothetical protein BOW42_05985 [Solemya velum gill symbiont]OOZ59255.1 hypothetical protein BOW43_06790 [Solemya velum gill symbiont]OOZ66931.1 hypothetical protein BOW46_05465 [Solemya velum gill symbiont]
MSLDSHFWSSVFLIIRVDQLIGGGSLELCDITRSQINLDAEKLYEGVDSVPSGVVQIAELQNEGFAYIKIE